MNTLQVGNEVTLKNGSKYEVIKVNRVKFVGRDKKTGVDYNIPKTMILESGSEVITRESYDYKKLEKGQFFWINKSEKAIVFKFVELRGDDIIGESPINGVNTKIDSNFQIGLIK